MTLDVEKAKAAKNLIYRLRLEIGRRLDLETWTQDAPAYYISHPEGKPSRARECIAATGVILGYPPDVLDLATCKATASSWYWDATNSRLYVHTSTGADPGGGTFYVESHFWEPYCNRQLRAPNEVRYDGKWCEPRLTKSSITEVTLEVKKFSEGGMDQSFGSVKLMNADAYFDKRIDDYIYFAAKAILDVGAPGDTDAQYKPLWKGWTGGITFVNEFITVEMEPAGRIAE